MPCTACTCTSLLFFFSFLPLFSLLFFFLLSFSLSFLFLSCLFLCLSLLSVSLSLSIFLCLSFSLSPCDVESCVLCLCVLRRARKPAAQAVHEHRVGVVWPNLTDPERALWRSKRGPLASNVLMAFPMSWSTRIDPQPFRTCRCGRLPRTAVGHHQASVRGGGGPGSKGIC